MSDFESVIPMREAYQEQLDAVSSDLIKMALSVGQAMNRATSALLDGDLVAAEEVIAGDQAIDALAYDLEAVCSMLVALQQPVATDLRVIMSGLRMSSSLERMGDLAVHVAKQARLRYPRPAVPAELSGIFTEMGALAIVILDKTASVIETRDVALAADVAKTDDQMDRLHRELFTRVLSPTWKHGVEEAIDVTLLSRYYERFADHAVTIARRVVHIVTGEPYASTSS